MKTLASIITLSLLINISVPVHAGERGNIGFGFGTQFHKHQNAQLKTAGINFFRLYGESDNAVTTQSIKKGKTTVEVGANPTFTEDGVVIDVVAFATGKGANYRKWKITDIKMDVGGELLRTVDGDIFWVAPGEAKTRPAAVAVTAINAYAPSTSSAPEQPAQSGGACTPGQPCGPSGSSTPGTQGGQPAEEKGVQQSEADRATTAAAMGLLVTQATGEIAGRKDTFHIPKDMLKDIDPEKDYIKIKAENPNTNKTVKVKAKVPEMLDSVKTVGIEYLY
ncbi:MAG: hypothetical protein P9L88_01400 [Candidatus Tantalella remota]|nr:hypothetical protein [Candidatus Tantalella remota]